MSDGGGGSLPQRAWQAALIVLATAVIGRVVWEVLGPLVPGLLVLVFMVGIYGFILRGRRY